MIIIVDRIEENFAVCELENGKMVDIPLEALNNPKEGDAFEIKKTENPYKSEIDNLFNEVFK